MSGPDQERRKLIKAILKGTVYAAPIITSMAAPTGLLGQGPSGMMMTICDYIPVLCWIFGDASGGASPQQQRQGPAGPGTPPPGQAPPTQPLPPSPGQANPPPGR